MHRAITIGSSMKPDITAQRLRDVLSYDPESGNFTWIVKLNPRAPIGRVVSTVSDGYIVVSIDGKLYRAHRLAWLYVYGKWPDNLIDHVNGNRSDNRIENLRDVSKSVNAQNLKKANSDNRTGLLGVGKVTGSDKFMARIHINGRTTYLGCYATPEMAHEAYLAAKRIVHEGGVL